MLKEFFKYLDHKFLELNQKWAEQQKKQQEEALQKLVPNIKRIAKSTVNEILNADLHFKNENRVNITSCQYNSANRLWYLTAKAEALPLIDLEHHKILADLNGTKETYFSDILYACQNELEDLQFNDAMTLNQKQSAYWQIQRKYELLRYAICFTAIKYVPDSNKKYIEICFCLGCANNQPW